VLAASDPVKFNFNLAAILTEGCLIANRLGESERALKIAKEAVEIASAQTNDDSERDTLLAISLTNLGVVLTSLGHHDEALAPSVRAVEVYRRLAGRNPDSHQPSLARSLTNLGIRLSYLNRLREAQTACHEGIEMVRGLIRNDLGSFDEYLAEGLNTNGAILHRMDCDKEAHEAMKEAVEVYRRLARRTPGVYQSQLMRSLRNYTSILLHQGETDRAVELFHEIVEMSRKLAEQNYNARPELAHNLNVLAQMLVSANKTEEAAEAAREGLAAIAPLVETMPGAHGNLARMLGGLYLGACRDAKKQPDGTLLNQIATALRGT
jgi:tetratricopeptide (TPR) repeat protein